MPARYGSAFIKSIGNLGKAGVKWILKIKTALIAASWDSNSQTMKDLKSHYETLCGYLHFQDQGQILGAGCGTVDMTKGTEFPRKAYELGRGL